DQERDRGGQLGERAATRHRHAGRERHLVARRRAGDRLGSRKARPPDRASPHQGDAQRLALQDRRAPAPRNAPARARHPPEAAEHRGSQAPRGGRMSRWERLRGHRLDLALAVVAVLLVGEVLWDRGPVSTGASAARSHERCDAWRPDDVASIRYEDDGQRFELTAAPDEVAGKTWSMTVGGEPVPVDPQAVESLLVALEYVAFERRVDLSPQELGLEPPAASLTIAMPPLA